MQQMFMGTSITRRIWSGWWRHSSEQDRDGFCLHRCYSLVWVLTCGIEANKAQGNLRMKREFYTSETKVWLIRKWHLSEDQKEVQSQWDESRGEQVGRGCFPGRRMNLCRQNTEHTTWTIKWVLDCVWYFTLMSKCILLSPNIWYWTPNHS